MRARLVAGMGGCKETNGRVCGELQIQRSTMLPYGNSICEFSISYEWTISRPRLTRYCKLVLVCVPITIEECFNIDLIASLVPLCPRVIGFSHSGVHAHLGCRRNRSTHAQHSVSVRRGEPKDIQALGWCPGSVVFFLQLFLRIVHKQTQRIFPIRDLLQSNFCTLPKISSEDVN
jgi:hypothetical protein